MPSSSPATPIASKPYVHHRQSREFISCAAILDALTLSCPLPILYLLLPQNPVARTVYGQ
jgi:hypothetical protein